MQTRQPYSVANLAASAALLKMQKPADCAHFEWWPGGRVMQYPLSKAPESSSLMAVTDAKALIIAAYMLPLE